MVNMCVPPEQSAQEDYAKEKDIYLVFENPKAKNGLDNDIRNMTYFKQSNEK